MLTRRQLLLGTAAAALGRSSLYAQRATIRVGYAAISWGGDDERAIREIAEAGYHGIQLRYSAYTTWNADPKKLRDLLASRGLAFAMMGSTTVRIDPAVAREEIETHLRSATFGRDAGGGKRADGKAEAQRRPP